MLINTLKKTLVIEAGIAIKGLIDLLFKMVSLEVVALTDNIILFADRKKSEKIDFYVLLSIYLLVDIQQDIIVISGLKCYRQIFLMNS